MLRVVGGGEDLREGRGTWRIRLGFAVRLRVLADLGGGCDAAAC